jgi:ABC-type transport system substrate-binding protein
MCQKYRESICPPPTKIADPLKQRRQNVYPYLTKEKNMKDRKLTWLLVLMMALSLVLAACGSTDDVEDAADDAVAAVEEAVDEAAAEVEEAMDEAEEAMDDAAAEAEEAMDDAAAEAEEAMDDAGEAMDDAMGHSMVAAEDCDYGGKIKSISALDDMTVEFQLCGSDPAFEAKIAFTPFGIQPAEWIAETGGTGDLLTNPVGTGPYMLDEWERGSQIVYQRFDDYWGDPAIAETAVLRWNSEGAARLLELQSGTVDMITNVTPDDIEGVDSDPNLQLLVNANPNVFYLGMTNTFPPFDNPQVRQAIAMGIDKQRIIDNFYPVGSEPADYFTPCTIDNACEGDPWYEFDATAARDMLAEAGYPDGFETAIYYRDVPRVYLPEAPLVAVEIQTQLKENLGIDAEVIVMESGEFIAESNDGNLNGFHMLGWGADYPHPTNFLDFHFNEGNPQFGDTHPEIYEALKEASAINDPAVAAPLYEQANNAIKELVPMIPIAWGTAADAALASVDNAYVPFFGATNFALLDPGKDVLVFMQNAEPISLYCADETDGESLRPCQQVVETLLQYATDSGETLPALATECVGNEDATVFTCTLREGVKFHDGSDLDAGDVVASWAAGIDAANPYHVGNTGGFDYYSYLWDGLINAPASE